LPNINIVDYRACGAMLDSYCKLKTKPKTIAEVKEALQVIWGNLPQGPIYKVVKDLKATEGLCRSLPLTVDTSSFTVTMKFWHLIIS